jgi:ubiquinone/menaquinone biosynthesis C-methylase UbiE
MDRRLLRRFLEVYPFQPATAVWRASEVAALRRVAFPRGRGLDLGCGDGRLTRVLSEEVGPLHLVGIDVDPLETGLAESEQFYEAVHTSSADRVPEPDRSFDFVVSISVMEHIGPLEAVLREVTRVLKPGGRLITTVPAVGFHRVLRGPRLFRASRDAYLRAVDRRLAHLRYWTEEEWRRALDAAGMRLLEATPFLSRSETRRWESISRLTAGVLHAMARGKAPIEIQRSLGLRRKGQRLPRPAAAALSRLLALGLSSAGPVNETEGGCLLVTAERP